MSIKTPETRVSVRVRDIREVLSYTRAMRDAIVKSPRLWGTDKAKLHTLNGKIEAMLIEILQTDLFPESHP